MPSKSRHGKRKRYISSKGRVERQHRLVTTGQHPVIAATPVPVSVTSTVRDKTSAPVPSTIPSESDHSYLKGELVRIGWLTGIILIIMILLALTMR
jgi:hypothetical protein